MKIDRDTPFVTRRTLFGASAAAAYAALMFSDRADAEPLSSEDKAHIDAVRTFAAGWKENDANKVVSPFADNCLVRWNAERIDAPPFKGKADFLQNVQRALTNQTIDMRITDIFALGPLVVNCHHQLFDSKQNGPREDLYLGIYFFENGKIREWNDYAVFAPRPRTSNPKGFDRFSRVNP